MDTTIKPFVLPTLEEAIARFNSAGAYGRAIDGRDGARLSHWLTVEQLSACGMEAKDPSTWTVDRRWELEAVMGQVKDDVAFAFEKALDQRGISASCMHAVLKMWARILIPDEDMPTGEDDYAQYGLPLCKAMAIRFGFPNEIGDDTGSERKYSDS